MISASTSVVKVKKAMMWELVLFFYVLWRNMMTKRNGWVSPNKTNKRSDILKHVTERFSSDEPVTFHSAIRTTVIVGQCFGLNPVLGVCEKDPAKLRFKYLSFRCAYTFISMVGQFLMALVLFLSLFINNRLSTIDSATALMFYSLGLLTTMSFLRIAISWPKLSMQIAQMEAVDPTTDSMLKIKLNVSCCVVLTLALIEHVLSIFHGIDMASGCEIGVPMYEGFIRQCFPWVYLVIPHNNMPGLVISHLLNVQSTFNWNFSDLFIICISIYLTSRLGQITEKVSAAKEKNLPASFWYTMREDYNTVVQLVRQFDITIGGLIFMSFANNLLFICAQLLHTLAGGLQNFGKCKDETEPVGEHMFEKIHPVYFMYSFVFLLARSLAVSLTAAKVHAASLEPAYSLYSVSTPSYCIEVGRFIDQIQGSNVALSGLQFFSVKRGLILTIAGTIVTYELVLMQFTGVTPTPAPPSAKPG